MSALLNEAFVSNLALNEQVELRYFSLIHPDLTTCIMDDDSRVFNWLFRLELTHFRLDYHLSKLRRTFVGVSVFYR